MQKALLSRFSLTASVSYVTGTVSRSAWPALLVPASCTGLGQKHAANKHFSLVIKFTIIFFNLRRKS